MAFMKPIYAATARFDTGRALTEDELRKLAPSVFANQAHESRSERFAPIPTIDIVRGLASEGFFVVGAKQSSSRDAGRRDFTKHLLRIRRLDQQIAVGDTVYEMLLKNANDGTSGYDMMGGLFRATCLNSMVVQIDTVDTVKVRHSGKALENVIEGTYKLLGESEAVMRAPQDWPQIKMDRDEQRALATATHALRFEVDEDGPRGAAEAIHPYHMLRPRRVEDRGSDLWTTFNVLQENAIKGGLSGEALDANNRQRRYTTRQIKGIDQDVKLNRALWILGEEMARLKGARA